jgi:hypothetical protein
MFKLFRVLRDTNRRFGAAMAEMEEIFRREHQDFSRLHPAVLRALIKQAINEGGERTFEAFIAIRKNIDQLEVTDEQKKSALVDIYKARTKTYRVTRRDKTARGPST